jgi:hypothetical protein
VRVSGFRDGPPPLAAVRVLLDWLSDGIERAVRLRLEGRSNALGPRPRWASIAREIGVERLEAGSIDLALTMPNLGELLGAHPVWMQPGLFLGQPRPDQSPLDLFSEAVLDAARENDDALTLDAPLVEHIASAQALFELGASEIILPSLDRRDASATVRLSRASLDSVARLAARAPDPRRVRLTARLDTLSMSTGAFALQIGDQLLRGILIRPKPAEVVGLMGKAVVVEGNLIYRPSGTPLRLDALSLREMEGPADDTWARIPAMARTRRVRPAPGGGGFADLFEGVEGDEDDEEVRDLEEQLS